MVDSARGSCTKGRRTALVSSWIVLLAAAVGIALPPPKRILGQSPASKASAMQPGRYGASDELELRYGKIG